jgi:hypothetical protein
MGFTALNINDNMRTIKFKAKTLKDGEYFKTEEEKEADND